MEDNASFKHRHAHSCSAPSRVTREAGQQSAGQADADRGPRSYEHAAAHKYHCSCHPSDS